MNALQDAYTAAQTEWRHLHESPAPVFYVGSATCGRAAGATGVLKSLRDELDKRSLNAAVIEVG